MEADEIDRRRRSREGIILLSTTSIMMRIAMLRSDNPSATITEAALNYRKRVCLIRAARGRDALRVHALRGALAHAV